MKKRFQRIPKNYRGIIPTGREIGKLLPGVLLQIHEGSSQERAKIFEAWQLVIGEKFAPYTKPISIKENVLIVKVQGSTLYSLLSQEKPRLLEKLQSLFSKEAIQKIIFRIG